MTIKQLRQKLNLSQNALAEAIGVPRSSIRNYENNICTPGSKVIDKIQEVFGVYIGATHDSSVPEIHIQSPMGGEITVEEICRKVGNVDEVYVRVDHNKLYWVKGDDTGSVDIWD